VEDVVEERLERLIRTNPTPGLRLIRTDRPVGAPCGMIEIATEVGMPADPTMRATGLRITSVADFKTAMVVVVVVSRSGIMLVSTIGITEQASRIGVMVAVAVVTPISTADTWTDLQCATIETAIG
jgi:uncharacterized membrane protein